MYPSKTLPLSLAFVAALFSEGTASPALTGREAQSKRAGVSVSVPTTSPNGAHALSRSLVSLSIESDRFSDWVGTTQQNQYFVNTLSNLAQITGFPPAIRVGGNSEDKTLYQNQVQLSESTFPKPSASMPYPEATKNTVNGNFFALSKFLPLGTHMIWGVNFGANNATNALEEVKAIRQAFQIGGPAFYAGIVVDAIEIGNEADLYGGNGLRSSGWDIDQYISQWTENANTIVKGASLAQKPAPGLLLGSFGASTYKASGFGPQYLIKNSAIEALKPYTSFYSQHHYGGSACVGNSGELQALMAKAGIRKQIAEFDADIKAVNAAGMTYIFGETNSAACHGTSGVSNTAGAAIWALDYTLQAASHNVSRVHFHEGIGFKYNLIQPISLDVSSTTGQPLSSSRAPHVEPQYYAGVVAASFVGSSQNGKIQATTISELEITDSTGNVSGYAAFDDGKLGRAVLINSNVWLSSSKGSRPSVSVTLNVGSGPSKVQVRRLTINHADDSAGLKFGGISYETSSGLPSGTDTFNTVDVKNGSFEVSISSTEAVLLSFE